MYLCKAGNPMTGLCTVHPTLTSELYTVAQPFRINDCSTLLHLSWLLLLTQHVRNAVTRSGIPQKSRGPMAQLRGVI